MSTVLDTPLLNAAQLDANAAALEPWPLPAELVVAGRPDASGRILAQSADGRRTSGIWACTPGRLRWTWTSDETVTVVQGRATVDLSDGRRLELAPGDMVFFETGLCSTWTVHEPFRKAFHTYEAAPARAGA